MQIIFWKYMYYVILLLISIKAGYVYRFNNDFWFS